MGAGRSNNQFTPEVIASFALLDINVDHLFKLFIALPNVEAKNSFIVHLAREAFPEDLRPEQATTKCYFVPIKGVRPRPDIIGGGTILMVGSDSVRNCVIACTDSPGIRSDLGFRSKKLHRST